MNHAEQRGLNRFSLSSERYPLMVNVTGCVELPMDFETVNEEGREDFYFFYLVQGTMDVETEDGFVEARAGSVALFYPRRRYCYRNRSGAPIKYYFVHYTGAEAQRFTEECGFFDHGVFFIGVKERLISALEGLRREYLHRREGFELLCGGEMARILVMAMRYHSEPAAKKELFASLDYIHSHFSEDLSVEELAEREHLSPGRYRTVFRQVWGMSPKEYLIRLRMDKSMELLSGTDLSVGEVAGLVGFSDPLYFSRLFRKKTGISPLAYRKKK